MQMPLISSRTRLHSAVRRRGLVRLALAAMTLTGAGGLAAVTAEQGAGASSSPAPSCSTSAVKVLVTTNSHSYQPGSIVKMTFSVLNRSSSTCSITIGADSPSFTVMNSTNKIEWNNCFVLDRQGACPQYLAVHDLAPGARFSKVVAWDQRAGTPLNRVAPGSYELSSRFSGSTSNFVVGFTIAATTAPRTLVVTQTDSQRSYVLHRGDRLIVRLTNASVYRWSEPTSANQAILRRLSGSSATATFVANANGTVRVTATDTPTCYPQCLPPSRLFEIQITVVR